MTAKLVHGIVVPMATPLTDDAKLDEEGTRRLVRHMTDGGVHGVFVLGTAGELPALDEDTRRRVVEIVVEEAAGRAKVYAGIGEVSTARTIRNARTVARIGADVAVVVLPYYFPLDQQELADHLRAVADASEIPIVMYSIPATTKLSLTTGTTADLSRHPNIVGIKDSSGSFADMQVLVNLFRDDAGFGVLVGSLPLVGMGIYMGADGAVPTAGNFAPRLLVELYEAAVRKDLEKTRELQGKLETLTSTYRFGGRWTSGIATVKTALKLLGICGNRLTRPLRQPDVELEAAVRKMLTDCGLLPRRH